MRNLIVTIVAGLSVALFTQYKASEYEARLNKVRRSSRRRITFMHRLEAHKLIAHLNQIIDSQEISAEEKERLKLVIEENNDWLKRSRRIR